MATRSLKGDLPVESNPALVEHEDAIGEKQGFIDVVRHQQDCGSMGFPERGDKRLGLEPGERVQRREGFVEQKQLGLANKRPSQRRALRFATRKGQRPGMETMRQTHFRQRCGCLALASEPTPSATLSRTDFQGMSRGS